MKTASRSVGSWDKGGGFLAGRRSGVAADTDRRVCTIRKPESTILVALGANLSDAHGHPPIFTLRRAAAALDRLPGLRLVALSRWIRTAPEPPTPGAPDFINGVARLQGPVPDPEALLAALHRLEDAAGRLRPFPNAPRVLDLDLLAVDGLVRRPPGLVLPHPRAHLRRFVLQPLVEVAAEWRHPLLGMTAAALLARLPGPPAPVLA